MSWTDDEIDELLVRYLDHSLSSDELEQFERFLAESPATRGKLAVARQLNQLLKEIPKPALSKAKLDAFFADRVIRAAQVRATDSGDASLAPWIARLDSARQVDSAKRIENRDAAPTSQRELKRRPKRLWRIGIAAAGIAASLLLMMYWSSSKPLSNTLLSKNLSLPPSNKESLIEKSDTNESTTGHIVIQDAPSSIPKVPSTDQNAIASLDATKNATVSKSTNDTVVSGGLRSSTPPLATIEAGTTGPGASASIAQEVISSAVTSSLTPSAEQIKSFESMMANPNGMFLLVIDVSLTKDVPDLDVFRRVLDQYDIAWSSELEINDATQVKLTDSRMIAEAGKSGLIPDFVEPKKAADASNSDGANPGVVSLVFVKARAKRLDAALLELMQRTGDFPDFSFDLAFDPPTHALMDELKFIQEAKLPTSSKADSSNVSSAYRLSKPFSGKASAAYFAAGARRSPAMDLETRRRGRPPLSTEDMNPVSYGLFIVRHSKIDSER
ncbi:MAG: hypothetical protein SGI77_20290 [Pirellulaceae bacterium]|nr:hypothetical protein [Pirellulaceae bacterium]